MATVNDIVALLAEMYEKPDAERMARVLLLATEVAIGHQVLERIEALERAFRESRIETDMRFRELVEAQKRTDERIDRLTERLEQLVEAQRRTDERVEQLAEAQRRTEARVEQLAEAQRRTEERVEQLAEAQRRTEERLEQLAEAQRRTQEELAEYRKQTDQRFAEMAEAIRRTQEALTALAETVRDVQKQMGGLSQAVGYILENEAIKKLPELLLRDYGLQVEGGLKRQWVQDKTGRSIEVNLFGTAKRNGETVTVVGESKSQLSKNDIDRFLRRTIGALEGVYPQILPVLITHMTSEPDAEDYARAHGVAVYYSYEL